MAIASSNQSGKISLDNLMNRALKYITVIKSHSKVDKKKVDKMMEEAWLIYSRLQRMKDEDQHLFGNTENNPGRTVSLESAPMRSGVERGFAHVKWEHRVWQAQPKKSKRSSGVSPHRRPFKNLEDTDYWVFKKERKNESDN
jgi:hypothetical protein